MCNEAVQRVPWVLRLVPDQYKTREMCDEALKKSSCSLRCVPDQFVTQELRDIVKKIPCALVCVPDQFVTQEMCDEVKKSPCALWWYKGYKQRKAQKAKIKEELMPVAWHPDRWWDWCVPEDEKKELEIYFA